MAIAIYPKMLKSLFLLTLNKDFDKLNCVVNTMNIPSYRVVFINQKALRKAKVFSNHT